MKPGKTVSPAWRPSESALETLVSFDHIEMRRGGREEVLDEVSEDYPYLPVLSQHDRYHNRTVPWHWHQELEIFYVLDGPVDYATPHARATLPEGSAGMVNANVLHMTRATDDLPNKNLLIHMFRPQLLADRDSLLWGKYVEPFISTTSLELLYAMPDDPAGDALRQWMKRAFELVTEPVQGRELRLRSTLSEVWLACLDLAGDRVGQGPAVMPRPRDERLKAMLNFVSRHYAEHIGVKEIADAAFTSERECHRTFTTCLGTTPAQYVRDYRIQQACRMLAHTTRPIGAVAEMTGLGSSSHFGRVFRASMGCMPSEYRRTWQDLDTDRQDDA